MTPKVSITAYCITQTSLQSACFNSLLWVGVTSTSTLMILGTEHLLEGSFAQASPIASPDHFSNQPVIELVSSELSNANQQDFVWAVDSDLEIVSIANQTLQSPESVVPSNVILGVSLLDETDRESSESVFLPDSDLGQSFQTQIDESSFSNKSLSIQSWLGVLVPHSSTEDAPDVSNGEIIAIDSDSTVALPFQPIQADVSTESSTSDAVYLAENSTAEALGHPLEIQSSTLPDLPVAQQDLIVPENEADSIRELILRVQGVYQLQGDESSARLRVIGSYVFNPNLLVGGTAEVSYGDAFTSSDDVEFALNELYLTISPEEIPNVRLTVGLMDLTSYFDRNSFAKDDTIHFFNSVFETNPALSAAGIDSRPGVLLNWSVIDNLEVRAAAFSSSRDLDEFAIDAFAGEVAMRFGNAIVRGTYVTDRDAGYRTGFNEIFQFDRGDGFGLDADDREQAYGINAEFFIPELNLGLFGRYGWYENLELDRSANTFNFGINVLNLFMLDDRLGLGYGRELSNDNLREDRGDETPDVMELFYDFRITPNVRVGTTAQLRDEFSESVFGFRIRADFDVTELGRLFR